MKNYQTIKQAGSHEIEIKKSRFICHLKRTDNEGDATTFIDDIKRNHWKATHNCSAYVIGQHNQIQRAHDDGEPSGTAGVPMLDILKKRNLKNVAAVVTRYFGGTKLGAGGLIRAYSGAVNDTINALGVVERKLLQQIYLEVDYTLSGSLENKLTHADFILHDIHYTEIVTFECFVELAEVDTFKKMTIEWLSGNGTYTLGNKAYIEIDVPS